MSSALAWVYRHAEEYGGERRAIFFPAIPPARNWRCARRWIARHNGNGLAAAGAVRRDIVSGYPSILRTVKPTSSLLIRIVETLSRRRSGEDWKRDASSVNLVTPSAPPFLLLHGRWEARGLKRQNELMHKALITAGVSSRLVVSPWDSHFLIVASLSHPDRLASETALDFIRGMKCS
jgi:acetyl esterase/lipase